MVASNKRLQAASPKGASVSGSARARGIVRRIAEFVVTARGDRASEADTQAAFRCILDLLSAAAAGLHEPGVVAVRGMALETFGSGRAAICNCFGAM